MKFRVKKNEKKKKQLSTSKLWNNFKQSNITEVSQKRERGEANIWKCNGQNVSKFHEHYKPTDLRGRNCQQTPSTRKMEKTKPKHIIFKLLNTKDKEHKITKRKKY